MMTGYLTASHSPRYILWRWILLATILAAAGVYALMSVAGASLRACESFRLIAESTVFAAAAVMGYAASRQFDSSQRTRLAWTLISLGAALFLIADLGLYLPSKAGPLPEANWAFLVAVGAITLSRILLVWALWSIVNVYRRSGLSLRLYKRDYAFMVLFTALNLLTLVFGANSVRFQLSTGDPQLIHLVLIICSPLPLGLVLCSVLAVIIWRYSQQMGGGLVAKAWRGVLLYLVVLPVRTVLVGLATIVIARGSQWMFTIGVISYLGLALAVWGVYLGASYQYEACTLTISFDQLDSERQHEPVDSGNSVPAT